MLIYSKTLGIFDIIFTNAGVFRIEEDILLSIASKPTVRLVPVDPSPPGARITKINK